MNTSARTRMSTRAHIATVHLMFVAVRWHCIETAKAISDPDSDSDSDRGSECHKSRVLHLLNPRSFLSSNLEKGDLALDVSSRYEATQEAPQHFFHRLLAIFLGMTEAGNLALPRERLFPKNCQPRVAVLFSQTPTQRTPSSQLTKV